MAANGGAEQALVHVPHFERAGTLVVSPTVHTSRVIWRWNAVVATSPVTPLWIVTLICDYSPRYYRPIRHLHCPVVGAVAGILQ